MGVARELGTGFAKRAATVDEEDRFVGENYADLKTSGLFAAAVPGELGGAGASHAEMCSVVRELARHCGSTALAFSMHTHQVMTNAWRWRHAKAPVEALLKRIAAENIVLLSSGGSDWLQGSGSATRVDGGFRIDARKIFTSGAPAGDLLLTSAVYEDPEAGPTVLHFGVPMTSDAVRIESTWRVMGMRGTGSHDVTIDGFFLPDAAVGGTRPQGKWHPLFHVISMIAIPLIYSVYVGIAEAARDRALAFAAKRRTDHHLLDLIGGMENALAAARLALGEMIAAAQTNQPGAAVTSRVFIARTLAARAAIEAVEQAMLVAGGSAFYRGNGLERLFRDVQAARYHPLQEGLQRELAARIALGRNIDGGQ
ncbi:MAG: acyl-CoA dehydrogenase [Betaproteobacteria bacterium SG8_39]|nr:MAG: acyl-CoA dehydrogenase [Betaproteobacteria bacterium SG8_39]